MEGYTSRIEAEDMLNINLSRMNELKKILEEATHKDFLGV